MLNDNQEAWIANGAYGIYARVMSTYHPRETPIFVSLPPKVVHTYLDTNHIDLQDIRQALEYKLSPDKPKKSFTGHGKAKYNRYARYKKK